MNNQEDIVLSSRVRLARNLEEYPFKQRMTVGECSALIGKVDAAVNGAHDFMLLRMEDLPERERRLLIERHLISPDLAKEEKGAALINKEETISILIGEEDHLRIQCLQEGLQLEEADQCCRSLDEVLGEKLSYAYDSELGFLTACPTNVGTGMRASVMLHLPALSFMEQTIALLKEIGKLGFAVRGIYGEGSTAPGHIYQISNQITLGILEEDILFNLKAMVQKIIEQEYTLRHALYEKSKTEVQDMVFRSLGLLKFARRLSAAEAMEHISNLKLGGSLHIMGENRQPLYNKLLNDVQAASLEKRIGKDMDAGQRDEARAHLIREQLKDFN